MIETKKPTFLQLRLQTGVSRTKFARLAGIAIDTQKRIETGEGVTALNATKSLACLNELLGTEYTLDDFNDVHISRL